MYFEYLASARKCMNDAVVLSLKVIVKNEELPKCSTILNKLINDGMLICRDSSKIREILICI